MKFFMLVVCFLVLVYFFFSWVTWKSVVKMDFQGKITGQEIPLFKGDNAFLKDFALSSDKNASTKKWKSFLMVDFILPMALVPRAGIEPARPLKPQDFKSCVSTNFTTRALGLEEPEIIYYG